MASTYELIIKAVDQTSAPMSNIEKALKSTNARTTKLNATLKKTNNGLKTFGKAGVKGLGTLTKGIGAATVAATAAAAAFALMARSSLDTLDTLGKTASKLGVTTEFLSKYQIIANRAGISTETFNMGLQRFLRRLGEAQQGTGELLKPLQQMGINMKDSNGNFREGTEVFAEFMEKLAGTESSTLRLARAMKGFDSEGVAMVNIAEMGADKIALIGQRAEEAGLVISGKLTKAAAEANDAMSDLFDFGKGFRLQFFGALSETIKDLSEMLRQKLLIKIEAAGGMEAFAKDIAAAFLEGASTFVTAGAKFIDDFINAFSTFTNIFKQLISSISKIPGVDFEAVVVDQGGRNEFVTNLNKQLEEARAKLDQLKAEQEDKSLLDRILGVTSDFDDTAFDLAEAKVKELEETLAALNDGSLVIFEKMATDSNATAEAVAGVTAKLDEQAAALRKSAEESRKIEELNSKYPLYDDAILRHIKVKEAEANANNKVTESVKNAVAPMSAFDKFMRNLTESASAAATKIMHEQQAVAELDRLLAAGKINVDTYAQAMIMLGKGAKDAGDNIAKMGPHISQFDQYMKDLIDTSNRTVTVQGFEIMALQELDKLLKAGKISLDAYAVAKESIRPTDFTKETEELTFQQKLVETYNENHNELKEIEKALANVSVLAKQAGVSEEFLTEKLKEQQEALQTQLGTYKEKALTTSEMIQNGFEEMSNTIGSELATAIRTGESMFDALSNAFKRTLDNILQQILTSQINSLLAQMFNIGPSAGGGGFNLGSLITGMFGTPTVGAPFGGFSFGGFRAAGGPVASTSSYLVGERGPELFSPTSTGTVTPMDEVNNANKQVVFNINAVDTQTGVEFLIRNKPQIINMVSQGFNQRGRQGITS